MKKNKRKETTLEFLQKQRKKANKNRKSYWNRRIDEHFFGKGK